jgi:hypothetical protein
LNEGSQQESVYAVPGPPIGKEFIGSRIVFNSLSYIQGLLVTLRERSTKGSNPRIFKLTVPAVPRKRMEFNLRIGSTAVDLSAY